jgi:hypothetical protein
MRRLNLGDAETLENRRGPGSIGGSDRVQVGQASWEMSSDNLLLVVCTVLAVAWEPPRVALTRVQEKVENGSLHGSPSKVMSRFVCP